MSFRPLEHPLVFEQVGNFVRVWTIEGALKFLKENLATQLVVV